MSKIYKVMAISKGYYDSQIKEEGTVFNLKGPHKKDKNGEDVLPRWVVAYKPKKVAAVMEVSQDEIDDHKKRLEKEDQERFDKQRADLSKIKPSAPNTDLSDLV